MEARIIEQNGWLKVSGKLDFATVPVVLAASLPLLEGMPTWKFDLSGVKVVNSAGLALLLEWRRCARKERKNVCFENLPRQLVSIAEVAGAKEVLG